MYLAVVALSILKLCAQLELKRQAVRQCDKLQCVKVTSCSASTRSKNNLMHKFDQIKVSVQKVCSGFGASFETSFSETFSASLDILVTIARLARSNNFSRQKNQKLSVFASGSFLNAIISQSRSNDSRARSGAVNLARMIKTQKGPGQFGLEAERQRSQGKLDGVQGTVW